MVHCFIETDVWLPLEVIHNTTFKTSIPSPWCCFKDWIHILINQALDILAIFIGDKLNIHFWNGELLKNVNQSSYFMENKLFKNQFYHGRTTENTST